MTDVQQHFLELVRLGIGHLNGHIPEHIDWQSVETTANEQGLYEIVLDGVENLPTTERPPKEKLLQWFGNVSQNEAKTAIQWKNACELSFLFDKRGVRIYVLKGCVVAECYPKPSHRVSIDMDCFLLSKFGQENVWEIGNRIIEEKGYKVERDFYKNSTWILPGVIIENHHYLTPFRGNKQLITLENLLQRLFIEDGRRDTINGTGLYRPPVMVSAIFLIEHAYSHFLHEGLTWRMVLDWIMFSKKHKSEINEAILDTYIDEFGFRKFYDSYLRLGKYLIGNLSEEELTEVDNYMLADIWAPLDIHETVRGINGKLALAGNTWRARWKYRYFTDITWVKALWIQVKGVIFEKNPKLN